MNLEKIRKQSDSTILKFVLLGFTVAFYIGALLAPDLNEIFSGFVRILTKPAVLTKDYFFLELGSISGSCLNAGIIGTICCAMMFLPGMVATGTTVAAFFLTVGFCFYGMNPLNLLPFVLGVFVYSRIKRQPFAKFVNFAMFSTALAPLISEVLFRYPGTETHGITLLGVALALLIGVVTGCAMPALCVVAGFFLSGKSFKGYKKVLMESGHSVDFASKCGVGPCVMNVGIYGLFILLYYNVVGATFTGPTFGAIWCMLAFCAAGAMPLNVLPIMVGYFIASRFGAFPINAQAIVVGLCFASGLAPITGKYGFIAGVIGGILHYCLVTSVPAIHGGFNLYNGGFTAGIVCFIYVPILEHYFKTIEERRAARR